MEKKLNKIVGITKAEFDEYLKFKQIQANVPRLIPTTKPGDEISLSSVFLKSLFMIKEFRRHVFNDVDLPTNGKVHVYTEVCFPHLSDSKDRPDGLILVERSGTIIDAALLELKKGNNELTLEQVERYAGIAKELSIPRVITISNQFVSDPTQNPLNLKSTKALSFFHLSWPYIKTIAHVLLNKDENIDDIDQRLLMAEVLEYLESEKCEIPNSYQMKDGWTNVVNKITTGFTLKADDSDVKDAVTSWHQEEMDLSLKLSKDLGLIVSGGEAKGKENYQKRIDDDCKQIVSTNKLSTSLKIKGAASKLFINSIFPRRTIEMCVELKAPSDKKTKAQLSWLDKQFRDCNKKNESEFTALKPFIFIDVYFKNVSKPERVALEDFLKSYEPDKDKEVREFGINLIRDFGKDFGHKKNFVENLEKMCVQFYGRIVEHLKPYEAPAPKISQEILQTTSETIVATNVETEAAANTEVQIVETRTEEVA